MSRVERAVKINKNGYNCAQSVLCAYSELTGLDEKTSLTIAGGLGGGLRYGEVCGAVSAAVLVLSMLFPFDDSSDAEAKRLIAEKANSFCGRFHALHNAISCRELLERTAGEEKRFKYCRDYVRECAEILEQMIEESKK